VQLERLLGNINRDDAKRAVADQGRTTRNCAARSAPASRPHARLAPSCSSTITGSLRSKRVPTACTSGTRTLSRPIWGLSRAPGCAWASAPMPIGKTAAPGHCDRAISRAGPSTRPTPRQCHGLRKGTRTNAYWCRLLPTPVVAIAGMDVVRTAEAMRCGAAGVAVISAITATDDPEAVIARLQQAIAEGRSRPAALAPPCRGRRCADRFGLEKMQAPVSPDTAFMRKRVIHGGAESAPPAGER
jgi:hypothetical protein